MSAFSPEKLRRARFERGWSQEALAQIAGVSPWSISVWESSKHVPRGITLAAVARALDLSIEALLEDEQLAARVSGEPVPVERESVARQEVEPHDSFH
jgi:transcriptional regulator with XRE-family HTH domain